MIKPREWWLRLRIWWWKLRYAGRIWQRARIPWRDCLSVAEAGWDNALEWSKDEEKALAENNPVDDADEELTYWVD